ncbi:MAG: oxidoreductase [Chloroflexota bacterium]
MAWRKQDMPDMTGKVVIVTGANNGLGYEAATAFAEKNATTIMAVRTVSKGESAAAEVRAAAPSARVEVMRLDLADLASITAFAEAFNSKFDRLDVLMNNAGVMATPQKRTEDGFELQFGTNHLGHFALTGHLLERLLSTTGSRVVNISSIAAEQGEMQFDNLMWEGEYNRWGVYQQSKLANLLFTTEMQKRLAASGANTIAVAAHPGVTATNLGTSMLPDALKFMGPVMRGLAKLMTQDTLQGTLPQLYAATADDVQGDDYFGPDGRMRGEVKKIDYPPSVNPEEAPRLWAVSEELTGVQMDALTAEG